MNSTTRIPFRMAATIALAVRVMTLHANAQDADSSRGHFELKSNAFDNDTFLPLSAIHNTIVKGVNVCSPNGAPGSNESPELSWSGVPWGTRSFVVITYDVTAAFTHWGMYNIPADTRKLPEDAGKKGSSFGAQIVNDFFMGAEYDGPCPPPNVAPDVHRYVFTIYALDVDELKLPGSANFPASAETLYHALIKAAREDHILDTASLTGLYSSTPSSH